MEQEPELRDMLAQFLGQTYSELHKIDKNITGASSNLSFKSDEFKRVASQVLGSVEQVPGAPVGVQRVVAPVATPVIQHQPQAAPAIVDPGQLEFNFDNSPTAKNILAAVHRVEAKVDALERKLLKLLDSKKK